MGGTNWNIQKVKRLKWKQLVQNNLVMLILFFLSIYYMKTGVSISVFFRLLCLSIWIIVAHTLYTFITGKMIGTKTSKRVFAFDRDYLGEKRWKRRKMIELITVSVLGIIITVLVVTMSFNDEKLDIYNLIPIIGGWLGFNIGETFRIKKL